MSRSSQISHLTPLLALLLTLQSGQQAAPLQGPSVSATATVTPQHKIVPAADVWQHPANYLGQSISIEVQMHSEASSWNPMLTRFGPDAFRAFRAWSDEQFPWIESEFRTPLVRVFVRRDSAAEWALDSVPIYARFELLCHVTSNFAGDPWIEVLAVKPRPRRLHEGAVIHATRGIGFMAKAGWKAALMEFERATSDGIPAKARQELERLSEICSERAKFRR